jgi:hypothetical protein
MGRLPIWGWLVISAAVLLSPIFGFLIAIAVEIFVSVLKDGGVAVLFILVVAGVIGRILFSRLWVRRRVGDLVEDQA